LVNPPLAAFTWTNAMDNLSQLLTPGLLIPVVAILAPLGLALIALNFAWKFQERKHKTLVDLLEKGLPVPRELLRPPQRTGSALMRALTLVGVGVGVSVFLGAMFHFDYGLWAAGMIPLAIGVAQLIALKLETQPPESDSPTAVVVQQ
jgi:hypothetical protein